MDRHGFAARWRIPEPKMDHELHSHDCYEIIANTEGEVAMFCGYYDPDYFCRLFRARTGMTPTAFQQKAR